MNEMLVYAIISDLLVVVYVLFVIMLIEVYKVIRQELKCLCSKTAAIHLEGPNQKLWMWVSYILIALEICLYILYSDVCILCRNVQCVRKVIVRWGYSRVQLKCDGTRWRTGGEVGIVSVHLWKVLEVMSMSVYTGLNFPSRAWSCSITFQLDSTTA